MRKDQNFFPSSIDRLHGYSGLVRLGMVGKIGPICIYAYIYVNLDFQKKKYTIYMVYTRISGSIYRYMKSRPAMPRVDASPCTTALVIHPTTNRPLSRVLFLLSVWSCWFVHLLFIHLLFLTIGHIGWVYYDYNN